MLHYSAISLVGVGSLGVAVLSVVNSMVVIGALIVSQIDIASRSSSMKMVRDQLEIAGI